jgi:hypothetical protein
MFKPPQILHSYIIWVRRKHISASSLSLYLFSHHLTIAIIHVDIQVVIHINTFQKFSRENYRSTHVHMHCAIDPRRPGTYRASKAGIWVCAARMSMSAVICAIKTI